MVGYKERPVDSFNQNIATPSYRLSLKNNYVHMHHRVGYQKLPELDIARDVILTDSTAQREFALVFLIGRQPSGRKSQN